MRKIDLRISSAMKRLADSTYKQRAIEIDRDYLHVKINPIKFLPMREREKRQYFQIYAEWMKRKVRARLKTYLDAFKEEGVAPNEADLSEMSWAFQEVIDNFTGSLPEELSAALQQLGRMHAIEDARRDIEIFVNRMIVEQTRVEARKSDSPSAVNYTINIGENRGSIQQGGEGNIQNTDRSGDDNK
jgi:hypothetical protein